jgi:hypothetical protein
MPPPLARTATGISGVLMLMIVSGLILAVRSGLRAVLSPD